MRREPHLPRREFMGQLAALGAVGLTCTAKITGLLSWAPRRLSLARVTCADFAQCLGSTFRIGTEPGKQLEMELVEARELRSAAPLGLRIRQPFSLIFRGEPTTTLAPQIYQVEHHCLGTFAMYLGPVNRPASGVRLEAVFS